MSDLVSPDALRATFTTLRGYLDDLAGASFADHSTKLRLFVNYFQKDDGTRFLAERLHLRLRDTLAKAQRRTPELPARPLDRLAFVYEVVFHLKQGQKLEMREFLSRAFEGPTIEARWDAFRASWLGALREGLTLFLARIEPYLVGEGVSPEEVTRLGLHTTVEEDLEELERPPPSPVARPAPPPAPATAPAKAPAREPVRAALDAALATLDAARREELAAELAVLDLESRKKKPDPARLDEVARSFDAVSPALGWLARAAVAGSASAAVELKPHVVSAQRAATKPGKTRRKGKPAPRHKSKP